MNAPTTRQKYWRSLAEAAQTKEYREAVGGEFSAPAPLWDDEVSRRSFLKLMGASLALSGLSACTREPMQPIVPYVKQPEELIPGRPLHYATAMPFNGFGTGLLVRSHEGHPTKIEGNPGHPSSLGATGIFQQAALLDLYYPDRSQPVTNAGQVSTWPLFFAALRAQRGTHGAGLRILTRSVTSPTLIAQLKEVLRQFPEAKWHQYQPLTRDNTLDGARLVFGQSVETRFHLAKAKVVVSLEADFLFDHPAHLGNAREFAEGRRNKNEMKRLYVAEPTPTLTGSVADHRLPASSTEIEGIAFALAREIGVKVESVEPPEKYRHWVYAVAQDLRAHAGQSLVIVGEAQPPSVHALVHLVNGRLGNVGQSVEYAPSAETHWINQRESLAQLVEEMNSGAVECLLILGGNPVFDSPVDLNFKTALTRVKMSAHLSTEQNETSVACQWHLPESHFLESWSDVRSWDGATSIIQPLISPLYASKTAHELLHYLTHEELKSDYDVVRDHWRAQKWNDDFEQGWRTSLHEGWIVGSQISPIAIEPRQDFLPKFSGEKETGLEISFKPDPTIWDGTFANNGWLQELPKPFSKVTWDNPTLVSPALAQKLHLSSGDVVELNWRGRTLKLPIWIMPGQAENSVTIHLGSGRTQIGRAGKGVGFNGYILRDAKSPWAGAGVELIKTGKNYLLATTQQNHNVEGRDILHENSHEPPPGRKETLYNASEFKNTDAAWGMTIDLNSCIGCNACVLACQAENNIPVVGKEQVAAGRDMAWIRIDHYFEGGTANPRIHHQPVPCMHCENAPCEIVCPVGATVHDREGLNLQVYNRCVGTRYCSNNCPYKVRRFNFFRYADHETPSLKPMRNPNVTVRWRGVMEKCTYCIQRISEARIAAALKDRPIRDGEIKTACQQVCPAQAITFGDINDPASAVAKLKASPENFSMLGELNTRPRTTYLARHKNLNPQLEEPA